MIIGEKNFDATNHTYIMGILNVTPDSFSDGGKYQHLDAALRHAEEMIHDGADILDVGGESTRPGHTQITDAEEIERVAPVIEQLKHHFDIPVSIDTYKSTVAKAALDAGADLVVGCHPHVLQGFEYYNGVPIIYSLGNYLFGNRDGQTVLLETTFSDENPPSVKLIPCQRSGGVLKEIQNPSGLYQKLTNLSFDVTVGEDGVLKDHE